MVHPMVILHLKEDSVKGIPYPLICFYYVQKGYTLYFSKNKTLGPSIESPYVETALR